MFVCVCLCVCVNVCVNMCLCVYVYLNTCTIERKDVRVWTVCISIILKYYLLTPAK